MAREKLIAGLDIGSSKVAVAVARPDENGDFKLLGIGRADAEGLKQIGRAHV